MCFVLIKFKNKPAFSSFHGQEVAPLYLYANYQTKQLLNVFISICVAVTESWLACMLALLHRTVRSRCATCDANAFKHGSARAHFLQVLLSYSFTFQQVRGLIVNGLDKIWSSSSYLRQTCACVCGLNAILFYFEIQVPLYLLALAL